MRQICEVARKRCSAEAGRGGATSNASLVGGLAEVVARAAEFARTLREGALVCRLSGCCRRRDPSHRRLREHRHWSRARAQIRRLAPQFAPVFERLSLRSVGRFGATRRLAFGSGSRALTPGPFTARDPTATRLPPRGTVAIKLQGVAKQRRLAAEALPSSRGGRGAPHEAETALGYALELFPA